MTPDELVQRLETIGWFEGLPAGERGRVREAAADRDLDDPEQVAAAVANLVDRTYRCVFDQDGDWAEGDVLGFIDGILEDRAGLRLFELPVNAPHGHLVVCRGEAFERAVAEGLVPEVTPAEG